MSSIQQLKHRIGSVQTTRKVTNVMKLVSSSKLLRLTDKMEVAKTYSDEVASVYKDIINSIESKPEEKFKTVYIILNSTLGLCGSYNNNIFKLASDKIDKNSDCILIGSKGYNTFKKMNLIKYYPNAADISFDEVNKITTTIIDSNYNKVVILFNHLVNSLTINAQAKTILPFENEKEEIKKKKIIFEPEPKAIIDKLLPIYISSQIYGYLCEALVAEFSTRRNAMDEATESADELINRLQMDYHQKRQTAITQQINEIVATVDL